MENTVVVLLLLCAFSLAEEPRTQNNPHPKLSDLYTQLGDMRVKLAEDRLMIQDLQRAKEDVEATLKEQESQLEPMKEKLQEQGSKLKRLEEQERQLKPIKEKREELTGQGDTVKEQHQVEQVAFSASLRSSHGTLGPYNAHMPLVFRYVITNIGNAYNPSTGVFTSPVRGAYHFEFYIAAHGGSRVSAVGLAKDGKHVVIAGEYQTNGFGTAANGVTLLLEAGDVVCLRLWHHHIIYDNHNHHSTFSGHLLFPM